MAVPATVSVFIPTLNRSKLAVRAVESALAQTYTNIDLVVCDDASNDDTVARLREITDPRLRLFAHATRLGVARNCQFGLDQARGQFFLGMGDDDLLRPTAIQCLLEPLLQSARDPSLKIGTSWCPCTVANPEGTRFWSTESGPAVERTTTMLAQLFAGNRGPRPSSVLMRMEDALAVGFQTKYGDLSDIALWGMAAMRSDNIACIPEPLVQYTVHQGNMTARSSVEQWQNWAQLVLRDMVELARHRGDEAGARELQASKNNFVSGITLTILMQTIGRPGWIQGAMKQAVRTPRAIFTPYMLRRLLKDGHKIFTVKKNMKLAGQAR